MPILLWDASALAKRYTPELGSDAVQALFASVPLSAMVATVWAYAEAFSILLRHRNRGTISAVSFVTAVSALENEILDNPAVRLLVVDDTAVLAGLSLMAAYNLNSSDAAFLSTYLRFRQAAPPGASTSVLVAADQRLLRAAEAEGIAVLNPETLPAADVPAFLAAV
jgi:predicted nucleic acid-binding protein